MRGLFILVLFSFFLLPCYLSKYYLLHADEVADKEVLIYENVGTYSVCEKIIFFNNDGCRIIFALNNPHATLKRKEQMSEKLIGVNDTNIVPSLLYVFYSSYRLNSTIIKNVVNSLLRLGDKRIFLNVVFHMISDARYAVEMLPLLEKFSSKVSIGTLFYTARAFKDQSVYRNQIVRNTLFSVIKKHADIADIPFLLSKLELYGVRDADFTARTLDLISSITNKEIK